MNEKFANFFAAIIAFITAIGYIGLAIGFILALGGTGGPSILLYLFAGVLAWTLIMGFANVLCAIHESNRDILNQLKKSDDRAAARARGNQ